MAISLNDILRKYKFLNALSLSKTKLVGRDKEVQMLYESLHKKRMKNAIIIGEAGVGKTAIVDEFYRKVKDEYFVIELNIAASLADTKYRGEFEGKVTECLGVIYRHNKENDKKIILFIDEIHTIFNAGASEGGLNFGNIIKPYLSRGDITIIGATTKVEYNMTIKRDLALSRRLSPIFIKELPKEYVIPILSNFCSKKVVEPILEYIYDKSKDITWSTNPDISIEILDRCMARKACTSQKINQEMIDDIVLDIVEQY